ncbi:hypothetical protein V6N13_064623 [Hibiscus sabdariffa]
MHRDFKQVVADNWNSSLPIVESIYHFTSVASLWNKEVFGFIGKNQKILMAWLRGFNVALTKGKHEVCSNCNRSSCIILNYSLIRKNMYGNRRLAWIGPNLATEILISFTLRPSRVVAARPSIVLRLL